MKVFIAGDIEGITGLVGWSQCEAPGSGPDWDFARRMYTHDINAAIRGAKAGGATEVVVKDSHNMCRNLLVDQLEPGTRLISGIGADRDGMMTGIDPAFSAAFLVGYHSMAGTAVGVMEHALYGGLHRCWINGVEAGEILASGLVAGAYGVPLALVTSDDAGCAEASSQVPGVTTYSVKKAVGRFMADLKHTSETGPGIEAAAKKAMQSASGLKPLLATGPVTWRVEFHYTNEVETCLVLPFVRRIDGYTIEFTGATYLESHTLLYAVFGIAGQGRRSDS